MLLLPILLTLAPVQEAPASFCATVATIALKPGEKMERSPGPDFDVFYVDGPGGQFGVYDGSYAQVSNGTMEPLLVRGGLTVNRVTIGGEFRGYLVANSRRQQNHFFGSVFKGDASDKAFFDRVTFGDCAREG
jgi:hypothetical protein